MHDFSSKWAILHPEFIRLGQDWDRKGKVIWDLERDIGWRRKKTEPTPDTRGKHEPLWSSVFSADKQGKFFLLYLSCRLAKVRKEITGEAGGGSRCAGCTLAASFSCSWPPAPALLLLVLSGGGDHPGCINHDRHLEASLWKDFHKANITELYQPWLQSSWTLCFSLQSRVSHPFSDGKFFSSFQPMRRAPTPLTSSLPPIRGYRRWVHNSSHVRHLRTCVWLFQENSPLGLR